ncbi:MAG TPA: S8 family serine peptidase, partial [Gemmataceae bacterium]|nr:S8 family serine peptidase [Gemmataceae bacterium]
MMTRLRPNRPTRLSLQTLESRDVPAGSLQVDSSEYAADRVIVKFQTDKVPTSPLARSVDGIGWGMYTVTLRPNVTVDRALKHFRAQAGIEFAEPDYTVRVQLAPNDPRYTDGTLWGMNNTGQSGGTADADIDAPEAWDVSTGSGNFVVAVIDTGVNYNHPDLAANMWRNPGEDGKTAGVDDDGNGIVDDIFGADFANNDGNPMDDDGHGTHVAGTIAAVGNNGTGVVGVNWRAKVMAIKFLGPFGGSTSNAVKSL